MRKFRLRVEERRIGNKYYIEYKDGFFTKWTTYPISFDNLKYAQKAIVLAKETVKDLKVIKKYYL
jgi:hypothetical protein